MEMTEKPIAAAAGLEAVAQEVEALPPGGKVLESGRFDVYMVLKERIPLTFFEISRQREIAFREVGEGTGKPVDADRFDEHYHHLFLWDRELRRLAGAYRLGLTDVIMDSHGPEGLYCSTLFHFREEFMEFLRPGMELGRSFVAREYQRQHQTLALLWQGIGAFVSRHPQYYRLFGPVSISRNYTAISKYLIVEYMERELRDPNLASWVLPRNPYQAGSIEELDPEQISGSLKSIQEVSARVAKTELDGKGIPILLRQYLKLKATLLSFNVDPEFSDVLDALVYVDLRNTPRLILDRYIGKEGARQIMSQASPSSAAV